MPHKNQHVVPHGKGWAVKGAGNKRATSVHDTQSEAIDVARHIAIKEPLIKSGQTAEPLA